MLSADHSPRYTAGLWSSRSLCEMLSERGQTRGSSLRLSGAHYLFDVDATLG